MHVERQALFDKFSLGRFELMYPASWSVKSKNAATREKGSLVFVPPHGEGKVYLFWGPLDEVRQYHSAREHAEAAVKIEKRETGWRGGRTKQAEMKSGLVNTHESCTCEFATFKVKPGPFPPLMRGGGPEAVQATYFHCPISSRYFVLVADLGYEEKSGENIEHENLVNHFLKTFNCHM
jgi:hypothetical protein